MKTLKLGTRGSQLAVAQSQIVADEVMACSDVTVELVVIRTKGDDVTDRPLQEVGGKGLFTKELEDALLDGSIDFAVHSMKDMPTEVPRGLVFAAVPARVDPRDALVGAKLDDLPTGAVVGTGSVRRAMQLRALRPDLDIRGIRGNVDTRINKQQSGDYDAVMLAMAGLTRLGLAEQATDILPLDRMLPAVGQGALALQTNRNNRAAFDALEPLHDDMTAACVAAERAFLEVISGGCSAPAACHAVRRDDMVDIRAVWAPDEHAACKSDRLSVDFLHARVAGRALAQRITA